MRESVIGSPPFCNAASTSATEAVGLADLSTAHAPATCGVAIEVPLAAPYPLGAYTKGKDDVMELPGASRLRKLALFEKLDIAFCLVVEPTLMADEMHAGKLIAPAAPSLPEATTVAMFAVRRELMAAVIAGDSLSQVAIKVPPPMLMFTEAML